MFQFLNVTRYVIGCIGWQNRATDLKNGLAFIIPLIDVMNRNTRFGFTSGYHGFMDKMTVHTFAPKFRQ